LLKRKERKLRQPNPIRRPNGRRNARPTLAQAPRNCSSHTQNARVRIISNHFTIDCKASQAKLAAAQDDLTDERKKTTSLTHERDDALRIARGGTAWRRIARGAKWFLIGVAAGAVAAKAAH